MTNNDEEDKRLVRKFLEAAGLQVEDVPVSTTRTCDFRAKSDEHNYLIEAKGFHDAHALVAALNQGKDYEQSLMFDTAKAVQSGIHEAMKQLESTAKKNDGEICLLALLVRSKFDQKVFFNQIIGNLLGKRSLVTNTAISGQSNHIECLYFSHSAFFRYRNILDGALVIDGIDGQEAVLYINDYANCGHLMRQSALSRFFAQRKAMHDLEDFEKNGFLVADCDIDRNNEGAVLQFVKEKYKLSNPKLMNIQRFSAFGTLS